MSCAINDGADLFELLVGEVTEVGMLMLHGGLYFRFICLREPLLAKPDLQSGISLQSVFELFGLQTSVSECIAFSQSVGIVRIEGVNTDPHKVRNEFYRKGFTDQLDNLCFIQYFSRPAQFFRHGLVVENVHRK